MFNKLGCLGVLVIGFLLGVSVPRVNAMPIWDWDFAKPVHHEITISESHLAELQARSEQLDVCEQQLAQANDSWLIPNFIEDLF